MNTWSKSKSTIYNTYKYAEQNYIYTLIFEDDVVKSFYKIKYILEMNTFVYSFVFITQWIKY